VKLDVISYDDLLHITTNQAVLHYLRTALLDKGIVGICNIPEFENQSRAFVHAARQFSALEDKVKQQYAPDRESGQTEGYELGAEQFQDQSGKWHTDDKKASFYAFVPDNLRNKWPREINLKTPYLELGELIFNTGKLLLHVIGINHEVGLAHDSLVGYGRMLHYHKENDASNIHPNWCGAHVDHGVFTGIIPAYYFRNGKEVEEPEEAGLYIQASNSHDFEKINASDKSVLLFQVGEFGQLILHDYIQATKHVVKKAKGEIERFTFALFYSAQDHVVVKSRSRLIEDERYAQNQFSDGSISYLKWQEASFVRYRARQ